MYPSSVLLYGWISYEERRDKRVFRKISLYKWHHPSLTHTRVREGCECLKWISEVGSIRFGQGPNR